MWSVFDESLFDILFHFFCCYNSVAQYLIEEIFSRMNQERRYDYTMCFRFMFFFFAIKFFIFSLFSIEKDSIANKRDLNLSMMILVFLHWPRQFYFNQRFCMAQSAVISNVIWTSILIKKKNRKAAEKITTSTNWIVRSLSIHWDSSKFLSKLIERAAKSDIPNYIWSSECVLISRKLN